MLDCWKPDYWPMCLIFVLIFHLYDANNLLTPKSWLKLWIFENLICDVFRLLIFHLDTKFGAKMLIDAEIMAKNRNQRWRPSAILDLRKPDFWTLDSLGLPSFHRCTKVGAKMLIDAQIMAKNRNSRWRPSAILELLYHYVGPPT